MKRKIAALGLVAGLAFSTTACGTKTNNVEVGEYKGLNVEYTCSQQEVTEKDIYNKYWTDLSSYVEEVKDKKYKAKEWDEVNIDYKGYKDGEAFEGGEAEGYDLVLGSGAFIEGFEDGLIGSKIGEKRNLNLTFPKDYQSEELAGKDVVFKTKVNKIYTLPELTDEFVKKNLEGYNTAEEYKAAVKKGLEDDLAEYVLSKKEEAVWEAVTADIKINSYPKEDLDKMIETIKDYREQMYSYYGATVEDYLSQSGKTQEKYEEEIEEEAKQVLADRMTAENIAEEENITVSDEEFDAKVEEYMESSGVKTKEELFEKASEDELRSELLLKDVKDFLVDNNNMKLVEEKSK